MGYITCTTAQIILLLAANVFQVFAITTRLDHEVSQSRNFRRHIGTHPFPDWELGLREAVYQALLRERNLHPNLREFLYSAPIIGHQDSATPFGDIVILARGQLYSAPGGFQFVQDPYQNDCDECHNAPPRCDRAPCENWRPEGHERLLALWTIKRIRHRDSNYGYRYELEYKVSPMNIPVNEPFVTRNGRFDYGMPGHTFIVKSNPRQYDQPYQSVDSPRHAKVYRSSNEYDSNSWSPNFGPNFDGRYLPPPPPPVEEYYDEDPRNAGYPNVLYGPPEVYTKKPPYAYYTTKRPQTYDDKEDEEELFKNSLETSSSKTSTSGQVPLSTASTQHIYTPTLTTKTFPQPTIPTTPPFSSKTTTSHSSYHPTSGQAPLLPTIPIQNSFDATDIFQEKPLTTHKDEVAPTKPLSTVRFPTTVTGRSTTSYKTTTIRFPESTRTVKYSEPDPLYINSVTPTQPTLSSKLYPTRTTKEFKPTTRKYKTTPSDDYDIFGVREEPAIMQKHDKQTHGMKFPGMVNIKIPPGMVNIKLPPGEQVIKVVSAPTIIPKVEERHQETFFNTEQSQPSRSTPKYQVNYNNTQQLQPNGESYITVGLRPTTRGQQSTLPTLNTESTSGYEVKIKSDVPQRKFTQQSSIEPSTTSITDDVKLTTTKYTTLSTDSPLEHATVTIRPFIRTTKESGIVTSSTIHETVPVTKTTGTITRATTPRTTEILSSSHAVPSSTSPPPLLTSLTSRGTKPILQTTRKYVLSTKATSPSTKTYLPTSAITTSTRASQPSHKTITTSKQKIKPTKPVTRKYKPPTQAVETTIGQETTYTSSTSSGSITNYHTATDSTITSTIPSRSSETTMFPTISIKDSDSATQSTVLTTNVDTSTSIFSTNIPKTTNALPKSRKPISLPTINTKSTLPVTYTAPMLTTTTAESTTPISRTSQNVAHSSSIPTTHLTKLPSTSPTTRLTKIPSRTASSTTQPTGDIFLAENKDDLVSKRPKEKPDSEDLDLDLFGKPQEKVTIVGKTQHRESFNSKEIDDIFGSEPVKKPPVRDDYDYENTQPPASTTNKVKIIYTDFFSPSTSPSAEITTKTNFTEKPKSSVETTTMIEAINSSEDLKNKTTAFEPLTSQSSSTSVSVEVNKKNEMTTSRDVLGSNRKFESNSKEISPKNSAYKTTTQAPCNTTEKIKEIENNKIFDMLALSVVNHAKSIDILNSNNNDNNNDNSGDNHNNTARERRYKRKRTYRVQKIRRRNSGT